MPLKHLSQCQNHQATSKKTADENSPIHSMLQSNIGNEDLRCVINETAASNIMSQQGLKTVKRNHGNDASPTYLNVNNSNERHDDGTTSGTDSSSATCLFSECTQTNCEDCMGIGSCRSYTDDIKEQQRPAKSEITGTFTDEESQTETIETCIFTGSDSSTFSKRNAEIKFGDSKTAGENYNASNDGQPAFINHLKREIMTLPFREIDEYVPMSTNPKKKMPFCCGGWSPIKRLEKEIARLEGVMIEELPEEIQSRVVHIYTSRKVIRNLLADVHTNYTSFDKLLDTHISKSKLVKQEKVINFVRQQGKLFDAILTECLTVEGLMNKLRVGEEKPINLLEILHYFAQEESSLKVGSISFRKRMCRNKIVSLQAMINSLRLVNGVATCKGDGVITYKRQRGPVDTTSSSRHSYTKGETNNSNEIWCLSQIHNEVKELKNNLRDIHKRILEYTGWPSDYMIQNHNRISNFSYGEDNGKYYRLTSILEEEQENNVISNVDSWRRNNVSKDRTTRSSGVSDTRDPNRELATASPRTQYVPLTQQTVSHNSINERPVTDQSEKDGSESSLVTPATTFADVNSYSISKGEGAGMMKPGKLKRNMRFRFRSLGRQKKKVVSKLFREKCQLKQTNEDVCKLATSHESTPLLENSLESTCSSCSEAENESLSCLGNTREASDSSMGYTHVTPYEGDNSFLESTIFKPESNSATSLDCRPLSDSQENDLGTSMVANLSFNDDIQEKLSLDLQSCKTPTLAEVDSDELDHARTTSGTETEHTSTAQSVTEESKSAANTKAAAAKIMAELFGRKIEECQERDCGVKSCSSVGKLHENMSQHGDSNRGGRRSADGDFPRSPSISRLKSQIDRITKAQDSMIQRVAFLESCFKRDKENPENK